MWAIKIFDDKSEEFNGAMLDLAKRSGAGVECALYHDRGMGAAIDARLKAEFAADPRHALGLHLSHTKLSFHALTRQEWSSEALAAARSTMGLADPIKDALPEAASEILSAPAARLAREAGWSAGAGSRDCVVHLDCCNRSEAGLWRGLDPEAFARESAPAIEAAWSLGLRMHLEKCYESRSWLMGFFRELHKGGLASKFGFTFDMGHSRVWEVESLEAWLDSFAELDALGFGLHFHLHANPGDYDRHDTLCHGQAQGWLDPDPVWAPNGAMPVLREIQRLYEDKALLVLENSVEHAHENLGWVEFVMKGG